MPAQQTRGADRAAPADRAPAGRAPADGAPTPGAAQCDVLVVGAGPTGLMAGLVAARRGLDVIVIDRKAGPTRESRALVIQARSLEILDQLGLADRVVHGSTLTGRLQIRGGASPRSVDFAPTQQGWTPFPGAWVFEQSRTEALLAGALEDQGCPVRYGWELEDLDSRAEGVEASTRGPSGPQSIHARWLIGADGASSPVRHLVGLAFEGVTDDATFCVADLRGVDGVPEGSLAARFGELRFAILFPMGPGGHARMIWLHGGSEPDQEEALAAARADLGISYDRVDWFSSYRVHHRLARSFRQGSVLLAGDAAHVHSPVGGQGMNTGLQDAHHLANLLADIACGHLAPEEITRYEDERRPVALTLIRATDRAFGLIARPGRTTAFLRRRARDVLAVLVPHLLGSRLGPHLGGLLGQYRIRYHPVPAGDPLPRWARDTAVGLRLPPTPENRAALRDMGWQLHTYGAHADRPAVPDWIRGPLAFPPDPKGRLRTDSLYLVRPDGYVAASWPLHAGAAATADVRAALTACGIIR
jgi:2-polyprenyl-6-methoxyphenol hydroxylase-like FAD-dependent oxidoreductase